MNALALTDHGNLHGALKFYQQAKELGINPILGFEAYIAPGSRFHKEAAGTKEASYHLTLLAQQPHRLSEPGEALLGGFLGRLLFPPADRQGTAGRPPRRADLPERLRLERAEPHAPGRRRGEPGEGPSRSPPGSRSSSATTTTSRSRTTAWRSQRVAHGRRRSRSAKRLGIPLVATSDVHYVHREDAEAQDILLCVNTGKFRTDTNRMRMETNEFYLRSPEEMYAAFPGHGRRRAPHARRSPTASTSSWSWASGTFPVFTPPDGKTSEDYLRELCLAGLKERYADRPGSLHGRRAFRRGDGPARARAGRDQQAGLRQLLPDRVGLRALRPRAGHSRPRPAARASARWSPTPCT